MHQLSDKRQGLALPSLGHLTGLNLLNLFTQSQRVSVQLQLIMKLAISCAASPESPHLKVRWKDLTFYFSWFVKKQCPKSQEDFSTVFVSVSYAFFFASFVLRRSFQHWFEPISSLSSAFWLIKTRAGSARDRLEPLLTCQLMTSKQTERCIQRNSCSTKIYRGFKFCRLILFLEGSRLELS